MSELVVAALKVAFLALMWVFILFAANVIRSDMFGRSLATETGLAQSASRKPSRAGKRASKDPWPRTLTVIEGRQAGLSIPLDGVVGLGRAADSALNLDDDYASTRHAQLLVDDQGTWWLEDLSSTNGTALNTRLITQAEPVKVGDVIRIGRTQMRIEG